MVAAAMSEAVARSSRLRLRHPPDVLTTAALQMLVAGGLLAVAAVVAGEPCHPGEWSTDSLPGLLYLIGPGSLVACVSLVWLLGNVPVWLATTYACANPAVALLLGWFLLDESLPATTIAGAALVVLSVVVVTAADKSHSSS
nr:EamA family transporter [Kibdelosporangium phytohabitans]